jgi:hypothetical protein
VDVASIIFASAAFIVAVVSLYLGNLRRADIEMMEAGGQGPYLGMHQERREEGPPISAWVNVPVVLINLGARPGVVTGLDVVRVSESVYTIESCHPDRGSGPRQAFPPAPRSSRILRTVTRRKLLRVVEIAEILGVSKQRAHQVRREPDFPAPVDGWARGDLWAAADVRRWARTYEGGAARWGEC